jgi:hypothetical protein
MGWISRMECEDEMWKLLIHTLVLYKYIYAGWLCDSQIRNQLNVAQSMIFQRSRAAEVNWSSDKCQQSQTGLCSFFTLHSSIGCS